MNPIDLGMPGLRPKSPDLQFLPHSELPRRLGTRAWDILRALSFGAYIDLCLTLFFRPATGLQILWGIIVPCLPMIFLLAPGVWRNLCPMAAANQLPRRKGFSRGRSAPRWMRERGYLVAALLLLVAVAARRPVLNSSGVLTGGVLVLTVSGAFAGGVFIKGKGGWCSSICPLLPVQRLYGQTPFVVSPNNHCRTCVGCAKNCYDFNPTVAYQADLHDKDPDWSAPRKAFAGALPGLVYGYYAIDPSPTGRYLEYLGLSVLVSLGSFVAINGATRVSWGRLAGAYGAVAFSLYYWWSPRVFISAVHRLLGLDLSLLDVPVRAAAITLAAIWFARTVRVEGRFHSRTMAEASARLAENRLTQARGSRSSAPEVTFEPSGVAILVDEGSTLLDVAERNGVAIEAGCRMGMCGADPIRILSGAQCLSPMTDDERSTLDRMGVGADVRLACSARVCGPVTVSTESARASAGRSTPARSAPRSGPRVLIIGGGVAGVSAAETARRYSPGSEISIVGNESYPLYNRMGISRVIYGRSAMQGLHLLPETWYDDHDINCWLNTQTADLDLEAGTALLATGESVHFDRLVLATGATPFVPTLDGLALPGWSILRSAVDAIEIRRYVQQHRVRRIVVAGAGLLGLEAAYALHQLGAEVTVLERGPRLLHRLVDDGASRRLADYLDALGIQVRVNADLVRVAGDGRIQQALLADAGVLPTEMLVLCAGVRPEIGLAVSAGLTVARGIVVDDAMRTSHPNVFAAGDVAEHAGMVPGLWPIAVAQAKVAGANAAGACEVYTAKPPVALLKGVGIELITGGQLDPGPDDEVIAFDGPGRHGYVRLVLRAGIVVGALSVARPQDVAGLPDWIGAPGPTVLAGLPDLAVLAPAF